MVPAATTVGGYLQSLPNDRRVSMARVCSMIRRSARGVRESMRFGLAFYEFDGPIFAVKSHDKSLTLYYAEKDAAAAGVGRWKGLDVEHRCVEFRDLNCLPLDVVENIVRASLKLRRGRPLKICLHRLNFSKSGASAKKTLPLHLQSCASSFRMMKKRSLPAKIRQKSLLSQTNQYIFVTNINRLRQCFIAVFLGILQTAAPTLLRPLQLLVDIPLMASADNAAVQIDHQPLQFPAARQPHS